LAGLDSQNIYLCEGWVGAALYNAVQIRFIDRRLPSKTQIGALFNRHTMMFNVFETSADLSNVIRLPFTTVFHSMVLIKSGLYGLNNYHSRYPADLYGRKRVHPGNIQVKTIALRTMETKRIDPIKLWLHRG
jgi:hypothetical protein